MNLAFGCGEIDFDPSNFDPSVSLVLETETGQYRSSTPCNYRTAQATSAQPNTSVCIHRFQVDVGWANGPGDPFAPAEALQVPQESGLFSLFNMYRTQFFGHRLTLRRPA